MDVTVLHNFFGDLIDPLINPHKRIFVGYLVAALLIAVIVVLIQSRQEARDTLNSIFSKDIWFHRSSKVDYLIFLINRTFMLGAAPVLLTKLSVATFLFDQFHVWFDGRVAFISMQSEWLIAFAFTFTLFILDDGTKYYLHRLFHKVPLLWCFHKIHHDAERLTPFTVYRVHPVEALLFSMRAVLVQGAVIGLFIYLFGSSVNLLSVLGANAFLFAFNALGSNLRHSHIRISYGQYLECLFISPSQHQIHHSIDPAHYDRNFGVVLAIWDWMGNSLVLSKDAVEPLQFGTDAEDRQRVQKLNYIYGAPFVQGGLSVEKTGCYLRVTTKKKA